MKIFTINSQILGEFTANFKYPYSQEYSPKCESNITYMILRALRTETGQSTLELLAKAVSGYLRHDSLFCIAALAAILKNWFILDLFLLMIIMCLENV